MDYPGLALLLALGLAVLWLLVTAYTTWLLTHPPRRTYAWAVARALPGAPDELADRTIHHEQWTFRSRNRDLPVWDIVSPSQWEGAGGRVPDEASGPPLATLPIIILTHGWGDSRVTMLASGRVQALLPLCSRLILWDLPAHGDATGLCTLGEREPDDLRALIGALGTPCLRHASSSDPASTHNSTPPILLFGFSLGAIISLRAAAQNPQVAAVIAEAPYSAPWIPAKNVLRLRALPHRTNLPPALTLIGATLGQRLNWWPRATPPQHWLPTTQITQPTLILHGTQDNIAPIKDARALAATLPQATLAEIPNGQHHTLWSDPTHRDDCRRTIVTFVESASSRFPV